MRRGLLRAAAVVHLILAPALAAVAPGQGRAATLESVTERGMLRCGVVEVAPGFAARDDAGRWQGFDADLCRAFAAAALGDGDALEILPLPAAEARAALAAGEIDVLARGDARSGGGTADALSFAVLTLVDAQSFLVAAEDGPQNGRELDGARICVLDGGADEAGLANYARSAQLTLEAVPLPNLEALAAGLSEGRCQAISAGRLALARLRAGGTAGPAALAVLPEVLSRDQMGAFVRADDRIWLELVRWTVFALIQAEESEITQANVAQLRASSEDPRIRRFLGATGGLGASLGVADDWVARIIAAVGNYGELYERHLGPGSPLGLERGPNALWSDGGLLHAMPFQ